MSELQLNHCMYPANYGIGLLIVAEKFL